jgi:hypothetical protein
MAIADDIGILPPELFEWFCDVQRQDTIGLDDTGAPVTTFVDVYRDLVSAVIPRMAQDVEQWEQEGQSTRFEVFFPALSDGTLPDIRDRYRLLVGHGDAAYQMPKSRILMVDAFTNESEVDVLLSVRCHERPAQ